jgi:hypothetical protein
MYGLDFSMAIDIAAFFDTFTVFLLSL